MRLESGNVAQVVHLPIPVPWPGHGGQQGPQGPQGVPGERGPVGPMGPRGDAGTKGDTGPQGLAGPKGETGAAGPKGDAGPQGLPGPKGETGAAGPKGDAGPQGLTGPKGETGAAGTKGDAGPQDLTGPKGETGAAGTKGDLGPQGLPGPKGDNGLKGDSGPTGFRGLPGPQGETGSPGPVGLPGPQGMKGEPGSAGPAGPRGPKGDTGEPGLPGSADIKISETNGVITVQTPLYTGKFLSESAVAMALSKKSDLGHTHSPSELTGTIPNCSATTSFPICWAGGYLRIGSAYFKPEPLLAAPSLQTQLETGLPLPSTLPLETWTKVASLGYVPQDVFSVSGALVTRDGVESLGNSHAVKIRIRGQDVEVWLANAPQRETKLNVKIEYTPVTLSPIKS